MVLRSKGNINRSLLATETPPPSFLHPATLQENTHRLTLSMSADQAYMENQAKAEEEKLQRKVQGLSDADRKEIYGKGSNKTTELGLRVTSFTSTAVDTDVPS